jgi:hypothetical protein
LALYPEGSHGALTSVFAPKRELPSFPPQAAGLSNGVKVEGRTGLVLPPLIFFVYSFPDFLFFPPMLIENHY